MITINIKYGLSKNLQGVEVPEYTTVGSIANDFRRPLGLPESWEASINGEPASANDVVEEGDTVVFDKLACAKA